MSFSGWQNFKNFKYMCVGVHGYEHKHMCTMRSEVPDDVRPLEMFLSLEKLSLQTLHSVALGNQEKISVKTQVSLLRLELRNALQMPSSQH